MCASDDFTCPVNAQIRMLYPIEFAYCIRNKAVRLILENKPESLIRKHSHKTDKFSNVCIIKGWNHELPKGIEIRCSGKKWTFPAHMWNSSRFTHNNWKPVMCHSWWTTYVIQKCQICEQGLYDDHRISENSLKFPWRISLPQYYNNFETRINPPNRKSSYFEQTRA